MNKPSNIIKLTYDQAEQKISEQIGDLIQRNAANLVQKPHQTISIHVRRIIVGSIYA